jgi:hypothetical protein
MQLIKPYARDALFDFAPDFLTFARRESRMSRDDFTPFFRHKSLCHVKHRVVKQVLPRVASLRALDSPNEGNERMQVLLLRKRHRRVLRHRHTDTVVPVRWDADFRRSDEIVCRAGNEKALRRRNRREVQQARPPP